MRQEGEVDFWRNAFQRDFLTLTCSPVTSGRVNYLFTHSPIHPCMRSIIRSSIQSSDHHPFNMNPFIHSSIHPYNQCIQSSIHLHYIHAFMHSCIQAFRHSCIHPFTHACMHACSQSFVHSSIQSSNHHSFIHPFNMNPFTHTSNHLHNIHAFTHTSI